MTDIRISHHGAVDGVTGSCHQLHIPLSDHHPDDKTNEVSLLVDCGLFQGAETAGQASAEQLAINFDISTVQALLVTHCHIDHVGRIPYLLAAGFTGPIIATEATAALLPMVIEDALKVGVTRNSQMIAACLKRLKKQLVAVPYKHWHSLTLPAQGKATAVNIKVKFQPAGHILGSAYIEVDIKQGTNKAQRVVFSGDLGAPYAPLLPAPRSPYKADVLVLESTYGDKCHQGRRERIKQLTALLQRAISDNGIVIIPAFSVGRTQELLYEIEDIIARQQALLANKQASAEHNKHNKLANIEVIVDSPMAAKFTEFYQHFKNLWDREAKNKLAKGRHPLQFDALYTVNSHQEHLATVEYLAKRDKPAIVIAASGMCSGGRVVNYIERFISEPSADILFSGYQARGTLGRNILKYGQPTQQGKPNGYVYIGTRRYDIRAGVHSISGYSAHADQANLVNFVKRMRFKPKQVIIVHGDESAKASLATKLSSLVDVVTIGAY